ncbi:hypothetical protein KC19_VG010600 [Ceratodon purpureus]|uniref:Uncharacterized protein n=1 Tax=Ceratodon purpureus TaxID=3225 RepID=A0A8T0HKT6_CERPU|nr:hypothetical protein KC19_VG010600 [Ceratodon purpureus]
MEGVEKRKGKKRTYAAFKCVGLVDWKEPNLPVWIGAAFWRSDEFQHLCDAPKTLLWLQSISEFEECLGWSVPTSRQCRTSERLHGRGFKLRRRSSPFRLQLTPLA